LSVKSHHPKSETSIGSEELGGIVVDPKLLVEPPTWVINYIYIKCLTGEVRSLLTALTLKAKKETKHAHVAVKLDFIIIAAKLVDPWELCGRKLNCFYPKAKTISFLESLCNLKKMFSMIIM